MILALAMTLLSISDYVLFSTIIYGVFAMSGEYSLKKSFIPVYRYYNLFNFYNGRVYKRSYSNIFIIFFFVSFIGEIIFALLGYSSEAMLMNLVKTGEINKVLYYKFLSFETLVGIAQDLFELLLLYPLAKKYSHKIIIISIYTALSIYDYVVKYYYSFKIFQLIELNNKVINLEEINNLRINLKQYSNVNNVGYFIVTIFIFYICYTYYKKWKKGEDVIVDRVTFGQINNDKQKLKNTKSIYN